MTKQQHPITYLLAATFLAALFLFGTKAAACPPPIEITINCPTGDCEVGDIIIVTGDDNEVTTEENKGGLEEIIDDILDFFKNIFKKKGGGGDDGDDGGDDGDGSGSGSEGGDKGGGENTGGAPSGDGGGSQSATSQVEQRLDEIADSYFKGGKITAEGIILNTNSTQSCQVELTMSYNFDIPIPQKWLKKYNITGSRKLKAGKYSVQKNGKLFLPFKKS
ncbi:hypothetical protein C7N43_11695 [Sphingobacteriales bacterium UPWRP_1]|nr:hypothetical protein B6N25_13455 [Sphingobacteriales bacterium TSM_CSS]PSJ76792.1 hypothetical protein C7N43_11695 [Sphingobacteriales bacterium UPWRP_1]